MDEQQKNQIAPALEAIRNVSGAALHNINNLLSPALLTLAKVEMFLETGKIEELKKELPTMIANVENHITAVSETLRYMNGVVMSSPEKLSELRSVDMKNELKKLVEPIIKR